MIGTKIVYFSTRDMNEGSTTTLWEVSRWKSVTIDSYFKDRLVVLNAYEDDDGSFFINQTDYGNYRDTTRIVTPTVSNYIQYE